MVIQEQKTNKERIRSIDIFKGLCIVLVVLGHSWAPFVIYIYMFHMPAFIVVSGYTYRSQQETIINFFWKKTKSLLLPFYACNLLFIFVYQLFDTCGVLNQLTQYENYSPSSAIKELFLFGNVSGFGGATWFLVVLCGASILYKLYEKIGEHSHVIITYGLSFISMLVGWELIKTPFLKAYYIDLIFFAVGFFAFGNFLNKYNLLQKNEDNWELIIVAILCTVFFGSFYFSNLPMNWPTRLFDNSIFIQILSCMLSMYLAWKLALQFEKIKSVGAVFEYIGKRTYTILVYHFFMFKVEFAFLVLFGIFDYEYLQELTPRYYSSGIWWIILPVINVCLCMIMEKIGKNYAVINYLLNGKMRKKNVSKVK